MFLARGKEVLPVKEIVGDEIADDKRLWRRDIVHIQWGITHLFERKKCVMRIVSYRLIEIS